MYLEFQRAKPIRMHHTSSRTNKCFLFLQCVILLWPAITENMDSRLFSIPAIFRLLYGTGMRVSEATSLLNQDINLEKRVITIRKTKNQRQRLIPVCPSLHQMLSQYVEARNRLPLPHVNAMESPFFISPSGLPLNQSRVYAWFRIILRKCSIPHCAKKGPRVHDLRHTFAVHSLMRQVRNGADIYCTLPILSVFLGHKKAVRYGNLCAADTRDVSGCTETGKFHYKFFIPRFTQ